MIHFYGWGCENNQHSALYVMNTSRGANKRCDWTHMLKFCVKELGLGALKCIVPSKHAQASMKLNLHTSPIGTNKRLILVPRKQGQTNLLPSWTPSPHFVKHKHRRYFGRVLSLCFGNELLLLVGKVSSRFGALSGSSLLASSPSWQGYCV
jgi:hypothetical protein